MPLNNLKENFLYNLIPENVRIQDIKKLIEAVVGGYQERVKDLRSYIGQINEIYDPNNDISIDRPVVNLTYTNDVGINITTPLEVQGDTPKTEGDDLDTWAINEAGIDSDNFISAIFGTDTYKTALTPTIQFLAESIGAKAYIDDGSTQEEIREAYYKIVSTYFDRLKIKGTGESFEVLGKLIGFDDVGFIPLWSRLYPKKPDDIGNKINDSDFKPTPDVNPVAELPDPIYDPYNPTDGDAYTWQSDWLTIDSTKTNYIPLGVNNKNPFIVVSIIGTVSLPKAGPYVLINGAKTIKAKSIELPTLDDNIKSGFLFEAIAEGEGFNGTTINVEINSDLVRFTTTQNLSLIKFRSSYYNLILAYAFDKYIIDGHYLQVQPNTDLRINPDLDPDGTAVSPYYPWKEGLRYQPLVQMWPTVAITPSPLTPKARVQASNDQQLDSDYLKNKVSIAETAFEEVRPATRSARKIGGGFLNEDVAIYAPYPCKRQFFKFESGGQYNEILTSPGIDYPLGEYSGRFYISYDGNDTEIGQELNLLDNNIVELNYISTDIDISGAYNYSTHTIELAIIVTNSKDFIVYSMWQVIGSEFIRAELPRSVKAEYESKHSIEYSLRPEDEMDFSDIYSIADEYVFRSGFTAQGDDFDFSSFGSENRLGEKTYYDNDISVLDQEGDEYELVAVPYASGRASVRFIQRDSSEYGRKSAIAIDSFDNKYVTSIVAGRLVASLVAFNTDEYRSGLVCHFPFSDHPLDNYITKDYSKHFLTIEDINAGNFMATYEVTDRIFDANRGWVLNIGIGKSIEIIKERDISNEYSLSLWINPSLSAVANSSYYFFEHGPIKLKLINNHVDHKDLIQVYVDDGTNFNLCGSVTVVQEQFNFIGLQVKKLDNFNRFLVDHIATIHVDDLESRQNINGNIVQPGETVLLTNQAASTQNGVWLVRIGNWIRLDLNSLYPAGSLLEFYGGTSLYRLENVLPINFGIDNIILSHKYHSTKLSCSNSLGYVDGTWADIQYREFNIADTELLLNSDFKSIQVSDLMIWNNIVPARFDKIINPAFKQYITEWKNSSFYDIKRSERYELEVLNSGYVFPKLRVSDYNYSSWGRVVRYDGYANYISGTEFEDNVGLTDGVNTTINQLGLVGTEITSLGQSTRSTKTGFFQSTNELWSLESVGGYIQLNNIWPNQNISQIIPLGGVTTAPDTQIELNPVVSMLLLNGDDGKKYAITAESTVTSAILKASEINRTYLFPYTTRIENIAEDTRVDVVINPSTGIPEPKEVEGHTVQYQQPPIYIYSKLETRLNLDLTDPTPDIWVNYNSFGESLGVVARQDNGVLSLSANSAGVIPVGKYNLELDVTNRGKLDDTFTGFEVEVIAGENVAIIANIMQQGQPKIDVGYDGFYTRNVDTNLLASELQIVINETIGFDAVTVLTADPYKSKFGGPYYVYFNDMGTKNLIDIIPVNSVTSVRVIRLVEGNDTTNEIQKILIDRLTYNIQINVTVPTNPTWLLDIYWQNELDVPSLGTSRAICIHSVKLSRLATKIHRIDTNPLNLVEIDNATYADTTPGGWIKNIDDVGSITNVHESKSYFVSDTIAEQTSDPIYPAANTLTGETAQKFEYLTTAIKVLPDEVIDKAIGYSFNVISSEIDNDIIAPPTITSASIEII